MKILSFKKVLKHKVTTLLIFLTLIYTSVFYTVNVAVLGGRSQYLDEKVYIEAGLKYVSGVLPSQFNFEHPPLAKYIIGLFTLIADPHLLTWFFSLITLLTLSLMFYLLSSDILKTFIVSLLLSLDILFLRVSYHVLLDVYSICFLLLTIIFYVIYLRKFALKFILLSGIFMGASLASKWNVAYTLLLILI